MGDYNLNLLNLRNHRQTSEFIESLFSYSFMPLINKPTRVGRNSATLIDNIFCNSLQEKNLFNGVFQTDISDHFPIFCVSSEIDCQKSKYILRRKTNQNCINKFQNELNSINWDVVQSSNDCQEAFSKFHDYFSRHFDKCFPIEKIKLNYKNRKQWLTQGFKDSIKVKNKLYALSIKTVNVYNTNKYVKYKRALQRIMKKAERDHYTGLFEKYKGNIKKSWELIKEVVNKKTANTSHKKKVCY